MEYTIKGLKTFRGTDGHGFNAHLYRDGVKVAFVINAGTGGDTTFEWVDFKEPRIDVQMTDYNGQPYTMQCTPEEAKLHEFVKGKTCYYMPEWNNENEPLTPEFLIMELVDKMENERRFKKMCKTKVLFRLKSDNTNEWRSLNGTFTPQVKALIVNKFGDQLDSIMNETLG